VAARCGNRVFRDQPSYAEGETIQVLGLATGHMWPVLLPVLSRRCKVARTHSSYAVRMGPEDRNLGDVCESNPRSIGQDPSPSGVDLCPPKGRGLRARPRAEVVCS
jgi:hypothetical protein